MAMITSRKVILVDDDPLILKLTRTTLAGENFAIFEASTGEDAVALVRREKPDLVLLDIVLPDINGLEVCKRIKGAPETKDAYVLLLTGESRNEINKKIKESGADDILSKPFSPLDLLKKIHEIFAEEENPEDLYPKKLGDFSSSEDSPFHTSDEIKSLKEEQLLMYALDLSHLHQQELKKSMDLKKAYKKLKEIEKMKDTFIALVSHEFRTPLSIIKGYLFLLQEMLNKSSMDSNVSTFMKPITEATERLENLMGELLDFSRMKSGLMTFTKKEINITDFMNLILKQYKSKFDGKEIQTKIEVVGEIRPIKADYERLKEALSHFVKNSLNFTDNGGKFLVECRDEGIYVEIKFIDTGRGIESDQMDKIFHPFYQTADFLTRDVGGMGLGLSIAKHIIEDHGGNIAVESCPKKGSVFTVRLPRSYQDAKEIVAELKQTYPKQIEELSQDLKATQEQLLAYAQELSSVYAREKKRTEQLEETLNALERTYIQTIAALSRTVDIKDAYKGGHTDRVSFYALQIAKKLNPQLLHDRDFNYSLLLHDIGKIGVAEEILKKVDKLTDEEWHILRGHSEKGVEILKDVEFLAPALSAVRSHHERWDGKGYPDGLKGEEIPLAARIIAVADSFDAMITDRPYRKGMTLVEAKEEISSQAGHQFDSDMVDCFLRAWEEISSFVQEAGTEAVSKNPLQKEKI